MSKPFVLAVANYKGGQGKTTSIIHLAGACIMRGMRTLIVDTDPQGNATSAFFSGQKIAPEQYAKSFVELKDGETVTALFRQQPFLAEALIHATHLENLFLLPASRGLSAENKNDAGRRGWQELALREYLQRPEIQDAFDAVFIDTHPDQQLLTWASLIAATHVYTPVIPEKLSVGSIPEMAALIKQVQEHRNPGLRWAGVVLNRVRRVGKHMLAVHELNAGELRNAYPDYVLGSFLPEAAVFPEADEGYLPVNLFRPKCAAALATTQVLEELAKRGGIELPPILPVVKKSKRKAA